MQIVIPFLLVLILTGALVWRIVNRPSSLPERFKNWAQENDVVVKIARRRYLFAGPFIWERSGIVYKIEIEASNGQTRTGWLKFGYDFFSRQAWSERVIWGDRPSHRSA